MGHAWMPLDRHRDDGQSECARNVGDVHTLYIRVGASPYNQSFQKVGVICSACYGIDLDDKWINLNEQNYETVRKKIPVSRRRLSSTEIEDSSSEKETVSQNDDNNDTG
jgi:hypothetical protein